MGPLELFLPAAGDDLSVLSPVPLPYPVPALGALWYLCAGLWLCDHSLGSASWCCGEWMCHCCLLGREQAMVEEPWLCLASHYLRSSAAGCRCLPAPLLLLPSLGWGSGENHGTSW